MDHGRVAPSRRVRMTHAERKKETRDALVFAALEAFTRDGYHAASLETIATDAGYSKGAIYSNFEGKAELFLAVLDHNLEALHGQDWDPLRATPATRAGEPGPEAAAESAAAPDEAAAMVRGFGLATLEFIATAARDDALIAALRQRVQVMIDGYQRLAARFRPDDEDLATEEVAQLMTALHQGVTVLDLSGITSMDGALLRTGLRRLLDPRRAADEPRPGTGERGSPLPDVEGVQRLISGA